MAAAYGYPDYPDKKNHRPQNNAHFARSKLLHNQTMFSSHCRSSYEYPRARISLSDRLISLRSNGWTRKPQGNPVN